MSHGAGTKKKGLIRVGLLWTLLLIFGLCAFMSYTESLSLLVLTVSNIVRFAVFHIVR
jgi:hypothetical protein